MNREQKIKKVCSAILEEIIDDGFDDFKDGIYSADYPINITLKLGEIRLAAEIIKYKVPKIPKEMLD